MDWWTNTAAAAQGLLDQYGLVAMFVFVLVEEAGLPIPIPGDVVMLLAGVRASLGYGSLWQAVACFELATVLGSSFLYFVASRAGRTVVYRYGYLLRLSPERLDRADEWLHRRGHSAVVIGRLIPGLRIVTALACGVFGIKYRVFFPSMAAGALAYILAYTLLGYFVGPPVLSLLTSLHLPWDLLGTVTPLVILLIWLVRARRGLAIATSGQAQMVETGARLRSGASAGALAALIAVLVFSVLLNVLGSLAPVTTDPLATQVTSWLPAKLAGEAIFGLFLDLLIFVVVGVAWGTLYAGAFEPRLRSWHMADAARGALFALVPLAATLMYELVILELPLSLGLRAAFTFLGGQGARYLLYGVLLGLICPILLGTTSEGGSRPVAPSLAGTVARARSVQPSRERPAPRASELSER